MFPISSVAAQLQAEFSVAWSSATQTFAYDVSGQHITTVAMLCSIKKGSMYQPGPFRGYIGPGFLQLPRKERHRMSLFCSQDKIRMCDTIDIFGLLRTMV